VTKPPDGLGDRAAPLAQGHDDGAVADARRLGRDRLQRGGGRGGLGGVLEHHLELLAAHARLQLVGGALGDDRAAVDDRDPVGQAVGLVQVLGGEQHRGPRGDPRLEHLPERDAAARVEPRGGLVEEQHRRPGHQGGGQVEPPPHAAGVGAHQAAGRARQREALEQLGRARPRVPAGQVVEAPDHLQVLEAGQVLVDRRVLPGQADAGPQGGRLADDVVAGHARAAAVGRQEGGEDAHRRGLARPVGAEQPQHAALGDREVDPAQRLDLAVRLVQALASIARPAAARPAAAGAATDVGSVTAAPASIRRRGTADIRPPGGRPPRERRRPPLNPHRRPSVLSVHEWLGS
jgi:hypothetical protein